MANHHQAEPDLTGIVFRTGDDGYQREQYIKLFKHGVIATRYPDEDCLNKLGLLQGVNQFLQLSGLTFACTQNHPTYQKLTLEFLSSYSYETLGDEWVYLTGTTKFRMFNIEYALTQEQLTNMLHFSHAETPDSDETMYYRIPPELDWSPMLFDLW